jgi:hypothetical protein
MVTYTKEKVTEVLLRAAGVYLVYERPSTIPGSLRIQ